MRSLFTIGHSNHSDSSLINLLRKHEVGIVVDVRSTPFSRYAPHFNQGAIQALLSSANIEYFFFGRELGARSEDPDCYLDGVVQYERLSKTSAFQAGIERLGLLDADRATSLLCTERDPLACHRTILIARVLKERGFEINHILADGSVESHQDAMKRLIQETKVGQPSLFDFDFDPEKRALEIREASIAFTRHDAETDGEYAI